LKRGCSSKERRSGMDDEKLGLFESTLKNP